MTTWRLWRHAADGMRFALYIAALAVVAATIAGCESTDSGSLGPAESLSLAPSVQPSEIGAPRLEWQVTTFGDSGGMAVANDVVHAPSGFIAVGVQYTAALPNVGPVPPHEGKIWLSADGSAWDDVTPHETFSNVTLDGIFVRPDGSLVALGGFFESTAFSGTGVELVGHGAWESNDGRAWASTMTGPRGTQSGAKGYLALVNEVNIATSELWHSADGFNWAIVRELVNGTYHIGAGDEGFVVVGTELIGPPFEPFAIASADGREWFESPSPPPDAVLVAPLGGDWIAISYAIGETVPESSTTWFSSDGLEWTPRGEVALEQVSGTMCTEYPSELSSAGGWLVLGSILSGPCSEGGFVIYGTQWISADGASWEPLPFEGGTPGTSGSGSHVYAAANGGDHLILVGQMNGEAAFWSGVPE